MIHSSATNPVAVSGRSQVWWVLLALAALGAFAAGIARPTAQSTVERWWTCYGNGPDNSRYFASTQITRGNVAGLQVAWTYPFGDAGSSPIVAPPRNRRARSEHPGRPPT